MKNTKCRRHRLRVSNAGELKGRLAPEAALQLIPPGVIHTRTKTDSTSHNPKTPRPCPFHVSHRPYPKPSPKTRCLSLGMPDSLLGAATSVAQHVCCCSTCCYCWCSI
ncbi:unnamed protein product, partial [Ectocarpus sp. 8 AP-2014]